MLTVICAAFALLLALAGIASLTQATLGVGIIAVACLFGILARVAQAAEHQTEMMKLTAPGAAKGVAQQAMLGYGLVGLLAVVVLISVGSVFMTVHDIAP